MDLYDPIADKSDLEKAHLYQLYEFCRGSRPSADGYQAWLSGLKKNADYLSERGAEYDRIMKRALGVPTFPYRIPLRDLLLGVMHDHENPDSVAYEGCDKDPCMWCVSAKSYLDEMDESHKLAEKLAALRASTKRLGELLDEYYALRAKYDKRPRK